MRKRIRLILILTVIALPFLFVAGVFKANYCLPIIMYHSVNPDATPQNLLAVTPLTFERQMRFLKERRYNVVPLAVAADLIRSKKKIPARTIAITFDDGYKDNYTYALPILKKYGLAATIFVIIEEVGRPENDRLSWGQIQEMRDSGIFSVGSHTLGAEPLIKIKSDEEVARQVFDSKKILEQRLGRAIDAFSYPEGMFNKRIRQLVINAGYKAAVATNPGRQFPDDDVFALKRLRISSNCHNLFVFWVETSGFYNFMREHRRKK